MFGIRINMDDSTSILESEKNLKDLERFVDIQTKKEYSVLFLKKYLKKELSVGDTRAFEKEVLSSFRSRSHVNTTNFI